MPASNIFHRPPERLFPYLINECWLAKWRTGSIIKIATNSTRAWLSNWTYWHLLIVRIAAVPHYGRSILRIRISCLTGVSLVSFCGFIAALVSHHGLLWEVMRFYGSIVRSQPRPSGCIPESKMITILLFALSEPLRFCFHFANSILSQVD